MEEWKLIKGLRSVMKIWNGYLEERQREMDKDFQAVFKVLLWLEDINV